VSPVLFLTCDPPVLSFISEELRHCRFFSRPAYCTSSPPRIFPVRLMWGLLVPSVRGVTCFLQRSLPPLLPFLITACSYVCFVFFYVCFVTQRFFWLVSVLVVVHPISLVSCRPPFNPAFLWKWLRCLRPLNQTSAVLWLVFFLPCWASGILDQ